MELVRKILIEISEETFTLERGNDEETKRKNHLIGYHLEIMSQKGLVEAKPIFDYGDNYYLSQSPKLTWEGQDYLAAIKDNSIWKKTKDGIKNKGLELGTVTFGIMIEYAKLKVKEELGI